MVFVLPSALLFVLLLVYQTGATFLRECSMRENHVFRIDGCRQGQVINVTAAIAGYAWPRCLSYSICAGVTYHPEIMKCNGQRRCNFRPFVLDDPGCPKHDLLNYIFMMYKCISESTTLTPTTTTDTVKPVTASFVSKPNVNVSYTGSSGQITAGSCTPSAGMTAGIVMVSVLLLLLLIPLIIIVVIYLRRRTNNTGSSSIENRSTPNVENTSTVYELAGDFYGRPTCAQLEASAPAVNLAAGHEYSNTTIPTAQPPPYNDDTRVHNYIYQ